ncbi:plasmodesmata-located protein 3-like [Neltuma alba]|uniref:plasmodesmata-located protein 3-like n=1 Tax=Neltuma alba TaxID=207710 RepID=UPI0010A53418|nr:plasmodesmata-located protein 3-like [Prosopis alba]
MLQPDNLLSLIITFTIWSWWTLNGVVSEPQTNLVAQGCTPTKLLVLSNFSIINHGINATFRDIRDQIVTQNKYFATAQQGNSESSVSSLFQCRNYLSVHDCVACFDVATVQIRNGPAAGGYVVYDGCFLRAYADGCFMRYSPSSFFPHYYQPIDITSLGKQGSSKKGAVIGGVVGGFTLVTILLILFICIRRSKYSKRIHRGKHTFISMKGWIPNWFFQLMKIL